VPPRIKWHGLRGVDVLTTYFAAILSGIDVCLVATLDFVTPVGHSLLLATFSSAWVSAAPAASSSLPSSFLARHDTCLDGHLTCLPHGHLHSRWVNPVVSSPSGAIEFVRSSPCGRPCLWVPPNLSLDPGWVFALPCDAHRLFPSRPSAYTRPFLPLVGCASFPWARTLCHLAFPSFLLAATLA
jgi:hypothetical protein